MRPIKDKWWETKKTLLPDILEKNDQDSTKVDSKMCSAVISSMKLALEHTNLPSSSIFNVKPDNILYDISTLMYLFF